MYLPEYESLIANIKTVNTAESFNQISNTEVVASFLENFTIVLCNILCPLCLLQHALHTHL